MAYVAGSEVPPQEATAPVKHCGSRFLNNNILVHPGMALLVGALLRLLRLGSKSLWLDEILSIRAAQADLTLFVSGAVERYHPPLYFVLLSKWMNLGDSLVHLRLLSVICGMVVVVLSVELARALFGKDVALSAAWLAATAPLLVWYSQEVRDYSLLLACVLLGLVGVARMLLEPRGHWWLLFVVGTATGFYTHYVSVIALVLQIFVIVALIAVRRASSRSLMLVLLGWGAAGLAFLPWLRTPAAQAFIARLSSDSFYVDVLTVGRGYLPESMMGFVADGATRLMLVAALVAGFVLIMLVILLTRLFRRHGEWLVRCRDLKIIKTALICAYLVLLVLSVIPRGYTLKRYSLILWPIVLLAYAWVWPWLCQNTKILGVLVTLSLVASILNVLIVPKTQWEQAAQLVLSQQRENDVVVLSPTYMTITFGYYARDNIPMTGIRGGDVGGVDATLSDLSAHYNRIWFVSHTTDVGQHQAAIDHWLTENARWVSEVLFYHLRVRLYEID